MAARKRAPARGQALPSPLSPALTAAHRELAIDKLGESGITLDQAARLGITALSPKETAALWPTAQAAPALHIAYRDPLRPGEPLCPRPQWPGFFRVRYLAPEEGFSGQTEGKRQRYAQPPGSGLCAYFPDALEEGLTWQQVLDDPERPLIITEGELKAAKATLEGFPTIGLGGVDSWRTGNQGLDLLPELKQITWVRRWVYIVFDSDLRANEHVARALNALAERLAALGALPLLVFLPDVAEEGKTGLDDYLVVAGADALADLLRTTSQPLTLAEPLWALNDQVIYVHQPGLIVDRASGAKMSPAAFTGHAYATARYSEQVLGKEGGVSLRLVSGAEAWLKWPMRAEAGTLTYAPGQAQLIEADHPRLTAWNTWPGWGVEPAARATDADVKPWLDLVNHVFTGAEPGALRWFLRWCAYPLQFPGTKLFSSVLVHGLQHGTGKSLIGYSLGRIYGRNFSEISSGDLHGSFNAWAEGKQLVMGDDVTGSDKREDNDRLKKLITQRTLRVNTKFVPEYEVPDCLNYYFSSNQPDAHFLEDHDRRHFVHEVIAGPRPVAWYRKYVAWLDGPGASLLFRWLLDLDLGDFDPAAPAFRTAAKDRMIVDGRSDLGAWARRLLADPDSVLRVGEAALPGDLFSARQLLQLYDPDGRTRTTAGGLGRELRRAGAVLACGGALIQGPGGPERHYAIRRPERWFGAEPSEAQAHLAADRTAPATGRKKY